MTQNYAAIQRQISSLQAEAARMRVAEKSGVIADLREKIALFDITARELFGNGARTSVTKTAKTAKKFGGTAYADGNGGTWGGRGKRPQWLRNALASGKLLSDFAVYQAAGSDDPATNGGVDSALAAVSSAAGRKNVPKAAKRAAAKKASKAAGNAQRAPKFRDAATGNVWTGRGPRPGWLKQALDGGKKIDDFRV